MSLIHWLQSPWTEDRNPHLLRCQELVFGFRLPSIYDAPRVQRSLSTPATLAQQLLKHQLLFPPASSGIDVTSSECAVVMFEERWYAIMPEPGKGYGLRTLQHLNRGAIVGKYDGYHSPTKFSDGGYVLKVQQGFIDADPCLAPDYYNGIPVGWLGAALLGYINEPSDSEQANVVYCEKDGGSDCYVVVGPQGVQAWQTLLVCYSSCSGQRHFHDCQKTKCADIVFEAQIDFVKNH